MMPLSSIPSSFQPSSEKIFDDSKKVLIVGGGLAGLALANVLKYQGVPYKVFERDPSPGNRTQGYSLSIHFCLPALKSGMDPVKYATLGETAAVDRGHPRRADLGLVDGNSGERVVTIPADSNSDVFRVSRERFRGWLLEGIDVAWSKRIDYYTVDEEGRSVQVTFTDGTVEQGSILVGADGINSQVCRQLIGAEDFDKTTITTDAIRILNGSYWIDTDLRREIEQTLSPSHILSAASSSEDAEHSTCLFVSLLDIDRTRDKPYEMLWSISCIDENEPSYESNHERLRQAKSWVHKAGFQGLLRRLVLESPEDTRVVPLQIKERSPHIKLDTLPAGPVILVGDAVHKMTQFRGEGANHAIQDSALLGLKLASVYKGEKTLEEAYDKYYKEMLPRGRKAVAESHQAVHMMHGSRAFISAVAMAADFKK